MSAQFLNFSKDKYYGDDYWSEVIDLTIPICEIDDSKMCHLIHKDIDQNCEMDW